MSDATTTLASSRQAIVVQMGCEPVGWYARLRTVTGNTWWRAPAVRLGLAMAALLVAGHARRKLRRHRSDATTRGRRS